MTDEWIGHLKDRWISDRGRKEGRKDRLNRRKGEGWEERKENIAMRRRGKTRRSRAVLATYQAKRLAWAK